MDHIATLGSWGELYLMLGTSSAALLGLLFVAASLHLREIVNDEIYKTRAHYTMLLLFATLVQAAIVLTPQPIRAAGSELLILNAWCVWIPIRLLFRAFKFGRSKRGGFSPYRAMFFTVGYALGIGGAVAIMLGVQEGLYVVTASYVWSLMATIGNAWNIMLGLGRTEKK